MKNLIILLLLIGLTGCNPIGSAVDKEGEETRQEIQVEMATTKVELTAEMKKQMEQLYINISGQVVSLFEYFSRGGVIR